MTNFIWHNPRCSKSRQTLSLLQDAGTDVEIIEYLKTPPSAAAILQAAAGLNRPVADLVRSQEALFKELGLSLKDARADADWAKLLAEHPRLIERPIVGIDGRYALGRPPENILPLLNP